MSHKGDIVVLTDATTFLEPDAVKTIISNFADETVGCVSSTDKPVTENDEQPGEGAYVRYEMVLRRLESLTCSLVGVSGSFYAVRKKLCEGWIDNMSSDFYLPIMSYMRGYTTLLDDNAFGQYRVLHDRTDAFSVHRLRPGRTRCLLEDLPCQIQCPTPALRA